MYWMWDLSLHQLKYPCQKHVKAFVNLRALIFSVVLQLNKKAIFSVFSVFLFNYLKIKKNF